MSLKQISELYGKNNPSIDDQIVDKNDVLYDVFLEKNDKFEHVELKKDSNKNLNDILLSVNHTGRLSVNGEEYDSRKHAGIYVISHRKMHVMMTNLPNEDVVICNSKNADIRINSDAMLKICVEDETFHVCGFAEKCKLYWDFNRKSEIDSDFFVGDSVIVAGELIIERREKQLKLTVLDSKIKIDIAKLVFQKEVREYPENFPNFRRSPRIYLRLPNKEIRLETPPVEMEEQHNAIMQMIVPPLGMVVASGLTSALTGGNPVFMLGMGGASLLTAGFSVSSFITNRKEIRRKNESAEKSYNEYLLKITSRLERLNMEQRHAMTYNYPSIRRIEEMLMSYSPRIYERLNGNDDFLSVSLGKGTVPISYKLSYSTEDSKEKSELQRFVDEKIVDRYEQIEDMPIVIPLRGETVGLSGDHHALRIALQTILFQVAAFQSYHDVQFIALISEDEYENHWKEWRWLPHFKMQSLNLRGIVHSSQTRDMVLDSLYQLLVKRRQMTRSDKNSSKLDFRPYIVLVIQDEKWILGHNLNEFLMDDMSNYGVTVIWAKDSINMLPETVTTLVDYPSSKTATLVNESRIYKNQEFVPNIYDSDKEITDAILHLSNLNHVEVEKNSIPSNVTFLELYGVKRVEELNVIERWNKADTSKTLAVPLGLRGKNDVVKLNLHERAHGPHGLIAGTTGSGKSEVIQSYMLSLAVNFAPEDVGFLPIDFKGGSMANLFKNLPHMMGAITNLDGSSAKRALTSIHAELEKRQRLFGEYGVNHINDYTKLYKQGKKKKAEEKDDYPHKPLPHLFLISDEFAELKVNEPDFMDELVSIARIGRSLGVHLILATQKPNGIVNEQIWSNSRFKIALKVSDVSDSNEILHTPDAASISQVGRAYLQVGNNEIYELFQTAYSGAVYSPETKEDGSVDTRIWRINHLGQAELITADLSENVGSDSYADNEKITELDAIVNEIKADAEKENVIIPEKPWLPPLPHKLVTPVIDYHDEWTKPLDLNVPLGMVDVPENQKQAEFDFDFKKAGHTAIYGSQGYGKSSVLQTMAMNLARKNSPEQVQFNLFDFGTNGLIGLSKLPHTIDLVTLNEDKKLKKYIRIIFKEMDKRKVLLTQNEVSTIEQYEDKTGQNLPIIITMIDGFDSVLDTKIQETFYEFYAKLLRDGIPLGIYTISTVLRANSFRSNVSDNIATKMALYLIEDDSLNQILGKDALIAQDIVGRMQVKDEKVHEVQVYLCAAGESDLHRSKELESEIDQMNVEWKGSRPTKVPMLPEHINILDFAKNQIVQERIVQLELPLGCDTETTEIISYDPKKSGYMMILNDTAQQSEYLERTLMFDFKRMGKNVATVMIDLDDKYLNRASEFGRYVGAEDAGNFLQGLNVEMEKRKITGSYKPIFVYVPEAHQLGFKARVSVKDLENILKDGHKYGIYLIFMGNIQAINGAYQDIDKFIKSNISAGTIGTRMSDQSYVKGKFNYSESIVGLDETNFFIDRNAVRIKLVGKWGDTDEQ